MVPSSSFGWEPRLLLSADGSGRPCVLG
ncbi:MAG: LEPR-XLL domain-containing protein [Treponema sp.]|nr:LEPR-XLL domain-containing protein [Treponema sp.]